jgi:phosphohistidine phosphatase
MKTLYIVRHGKSSWDDISLNDIERPLKKRGVRNSHELSEALKEEGEIPDFLITSPAVRAYETAKIFADHLEVPSEAFKVDEKLYLPDFPTILKIVLYLNNDLNSVMIVGHEPSLSTFINYFINKLIEKLITASVTRLDFDIEDWRDLSPSCFKKGRHRNRHDLKGFKLK